MLRFDACAKEVVREADTSPTVVSASWRPLCNPSTRVGWFVEGIAHAGER